MCNVILKSSVHIIIHYLISKSVDSISRDITTKYPSVPKTACQSEIWNSIWKSAKPPRHLHLQRTTYSSTGSLLGPTIMIHTPNSFSLPCAVLFINAGFRYETTILNWRAGASQPSRKTGTVFLFIYIIYIYMFAAG